MRDNQSVLSGSGNDTSNSSSSSSRLSEEDSSEDPYPWGDEYSDEYDEEQDEFFKVYYKASEEELEEWRVAKAEPIIDKAADVYVANLLADVSTAQKVLHDIPAGFKHLRSLAMGKLPWLRVDVVKATLLQHVVQEIKGLQHFHVGMHGQQQPTFPEQLWHKLKFTDWSTSEAKYADAYKAAISSKLCGTTADFGSYPSVNELQRRLQQQACWVVVCMWIEGY